MRGYRDRDRNRGRAYARIPRLQRVASRWATPLSVSRARGDLRNRIRPVVADGSYNVRARNRKKR